MVHLKSILTSLLNYEIGNKAAAKIGSVYFDFVLCQLVRKRTKENVPMWEGLN